MEEKRICKYCGNKFSPRNDSADACQKCYTKLKYVRKLIAAGRAIKRGVQK